MFELFHDKDNAILYLFNVVYMLYELCGYLYFFWIGFCTRSCRLSIYLHNLHLSSRGSLFPWTSWNIFFANQTGSTWGRAPETHWYSCCVFDDEVSAWVTMWYQEVWKQTTKHEHGKCPTSKLFALLNFNVNFRAIPTSRRSTPTWKNYGSSYLKWSRAWEQGWYIDSSCAAKKRFTFRGVIFHHG